MAWFRRWRIDSREKWARILHALLDFGVDPARHPVEIIVRDEKVPISGWRRRLFHACCADLAPQWGVTPGEVKTRVKCDFYGADVPIEGSRLTAEEVLELQRLLRKVGRYEVIVQSSEDSDDEEYMRLVEHLYQLAAESGAVLPDRRTK